MASAFAEAAYEAGDIMGGLYGDGIIACPGAFSPALADTLHAEIMALFAEARAIPSGMLPRGPERWYVETQPERLSAFAEIASHPWFVAVCRAVLGEEYRIIEVGFDIPFPGAFNLTTIDTRPEHGPFEIAPGTQWDSFEGCPKGMFPPADLWPRYAARAVKKLPRRGDISARSALTVHRGTANRSTEPRPVLVIGVDAPDATNGAHHDLQATAPYLASLPPVVRDHLPARVVDALAPVVQNHVIDGLLTPAY